MNHDNEQGLIDWAHSYNGYERIAGSPEHLSAVIRPMAEEYERSGAIPEWAGVDLLRGWAFYLVRAYRFRESGRPLAEEFPEFVAITSAINSHPASASQDRPPSHN
ncbi:hypothetical protein AB4Z39_02590 [Mycobacterium adipatum]|uniref:hypothetical protein n=1 Tax=Mycobacterium adipatum TaxID=1682113 RepID=UPI0034E079CC